MKIQRTVSYDISEKMVRTYLEDDDEMADYTEKDFENTLDFVLEGEDHEYKKDFQGDIQQMKELFMTLKKEVLERIKDDDETEEERRKDLENDIEYFTRMLEEAKKRLAELGE